MSKIVAGKKPSSSRPLAGSSFQARFGDKLRVPDEILRECEEKGLVVRWVDSKSLYANQGYHQNGWEAYKRAIKVNDFKTGNDPDGIVRRGTMILATRSKELAQEHRDYLEEKSSLRKGKIKVDIEEFKRSARKAGAVVDDKYEHDGESDSDEE